MRVPELKQVLDAKNETATTQRLRYFVEAAGKKGLTKAIRNWVPSQVALVPLAPSKTGEAPASVIRRWGIAPVTSSN
jgi:hypothetical protein